MKHYNPSINNWLQRIFNFKAGENTQDVADFIQPTIEVLPRINIVRSFTGTYTTPSDKDFYLQSVQLSTAKDNTHTGSNCYVQVVVEGVTQTLLSITSMTLTADNRSETLIFPIPIKLDRNTTILINNTGTYSSNRACITGYTQEVLNNSSN